MGVARGGDAAHADAVDLDAGVEGIGIGGVGAGAADVGLDGVVEMEHALVVALVAALVVHVEAGAPMLERFPAQSAGEAAEIFLGALAELLDLGVEGVEAQAEAREQGLVEVNRVALRAEGIHAHRRGGAAAEGGALRRDVDDPGGIDVTVGEAAGAAGELDALGVVGVGGQKPRKAVAQLPDRRDAAEANLVAGAGVDGSADGALVVVNVFGPDRELDGAEEIVEGEIAQEIGGEDGDGVGEIGEFLVGARAGEGGGGGIALVVGGVDLKGGQDDGLVLVGGGRARRRRGGDGLGGEGRGKREREGEGDGASEKAGGRERETGRSRHDVGRGRERGERTTGE